MMSTVEVKALISLLDDDDDQVVTHVEKEILALGDMVIPFLESEWEKQQSQRQQSRIEEILHRLQYDLFKMRLLQWYNSSEKNLLTGLWIIATYQYPSLGFKKLQQDIEQIYYETWLEFCSQMYAVDQIKALNVVFFNKLKFKANTKNFHAPFNSMINIVIESRQGNPITLCMIYMLIAQKLKLPIFGINLPNLFMLVYQDGKNKPFYINVFNKGLIFSREDLENYVNELQIVPKNTFFEPCTNIEIIRRILRNLIISFEKIGDYTKAEEVKKLLVEISDGGGFNV